MKKVIIFVDETDSKKIEKVKNIVSKVLATYPAFLLAEADSDQISSLKNQGFDIELQENSQMIRLRAVEFDTSKKAPQVPQNLSLRSIDLDAVDKNYWILQFVGPIKDEWKSEITQSGGELQNYIPENAFLVKMDTETKEKLQKLDFVNWIGLYEPVYKVSPLLVGNKEKAAPNELKTVSVSTEAFKPTIIGNLRLILHDPSDLEKVSKRIQELDGTIIATTTDSIRTSIQPSELTKLAKMSEVKWIEPYAMNKLHNDVSAQIIGVQPVWGNHGLDGEDQIVAVADTGIDTGINDSSIHDDFEGRIVSIHSWPIVSGLHQYLDNTSWDDGPADVESGHGSHVAGSVLGSGAKSGGSIRGMASNARLIFQAVEQWANVKNQYEQDLPDGYYLLGIPDDLNDLFQQAYDDGARIHTNSWGGAPQDNNGNYLYGQYTADSQTIDDFIWNHKDMIIIFSAGNDGKDANANGVVDTDSLSSQATSKNCITVGASENNRQTGGYNPGGDCSTYGNCWGNDFPAAPLSTDRLSNNPEGMVAFSSRGPADDLRIKPDVVAPGTNILSVRSSMATEQGWGLLPTGDPNRPFYMYMGGTSMSTPITAGTMALIRQYLVNVCLHNPTAALMKAILIHGAHPMAGQYTPPEVAAVPDNSQGWGRVNLQGALFPEYPAKMEFKDKAVDAVGTGESKEYSFTVVNSTVPLRATLVWTDYPSTPSAGGLVNTLRLSIIPPAGSTVTGVPSNNNVQQAVINNPQNGVYKVKVEGINIPHPKQDFALVVSAGLEFTELYIKDNVQDNGIAPSAGCQYMSPDIWVNTDNDPSASPSPNPEYGQTNYVFVRVHNRGSKEAVNAEVKLYWANPGTNLSKQYWKVDDIRVNGVLGNVRQIDVPAHSAGQDGEAVTVAFEWLPPDPQSNTLTPGHFCLFATVNHPDDPLQQEDIQFVRWEDNLAWKNVVENYQLSGSKTTMEFYVAGLKDQTATSDLSIDRSDLPSGGSAKLKIPTRFLEGADVMNLEKVWESEGHKTCKVEVTTPTTGDINGITLKPNENTLVRLEVTLPENTVDGEVYPVSVEQKVDGTVTGRVTLVARTVGTPAYIANSRTGEIHYPDCEWVDQMSNKNKVPFDDLELAIKRGYNGCKTCLPEYDTD